VAAGADPPWKKDLLSGGGTGDRENFDMGSSHNGALSGKMFLGARGKGITATPLGNRRSWDRRFSGGGTGGDEI